MIGDSKMLLYREFVVASIKATPTDELPVEAMLGDDVGDPDFQNGGGSAMKMFALIFKSESQSISPRIVRLPSLGTTL
jgi:hypothetical protein